jgi:hypothetical protein
MTPLDVDLVSSVQQEFVPDSMPPESEPPPCDRCVKTHGINDAEACRLARRLAGRWARCGLIHEDYDFTARILDGLDGFCSDQARRDMAEEARFEERTRCEERVN